MSYYSGRGDYYSGKGDPGFGSILGGIIGTVGKVAGAVVPGIGGVINTAAGVVSRAVGGSSVAPRLPTGSNFRPSTASLPPMRTPGIQGVLQRAIPGGQSGYTCGSSPCESGYHLDKTTKTKCVRNRKTNYTNPRALARASKRLDGFVGVARKALKTTNYKVVNKSYKQNWRKPLKR